MDRYTVTYRPYSDAYYSELENKGYVSPSKKKKPTETATQTTELELDEGYALGGVGECERQEVFPDIDSKLVISRPKKLLYWRRRKKAKATLPIVNWPEAHDARALEELARVFSGNGRVTSAQTMRPHFRRDATGGTSRSRKSSQHLATQSVGPSATRLLKAMHKRELSLSSSVGSAVPLSHVPSSHSFNGNRESLGL
ncbi:hypothetical protein MD484_g2140, partial [Candolleomyces efflorescens]